MTRVELRVVIPSLGTEGPLVIEKSSRVSGRRRWSQVTARGV